MSPLQLLLIRTFDADPAGGMVPLVEFMFEYLDSLDGTEAPEWRDRGNILAVLARSGFAITMRGGCRQIVGLSFKPVTGLKPLAPIDQLQGVRNVASK